VAWEFEKIKDYVKNSMSEKRFNHVLGVVETAKMLTELHDINAADAEVAALIHDVAKEQDLEEAKQMLMEREETVYLEHSPKVWHAPLGAFIAGEVFGIEDVDILNSVKYHTTGRPKMSDLEKVIFVADYTEPNRTFEGAIRVREFWRSLDLAVYEVLKQKVEKNAASELGMHPDTLAAYAYYKKKVGK